MSCHDFDELEALLNDELDPDTGRTILRHLTGCAACRERLEEVAANLRMIESLPTVLDTGVITPVDRPTAPESIGGYRVVREIGHGGMGIVYEALQENPERPVAVKVLHRRIGSDAYRVRLFRREARALARLRHPGIAAIHAADQTEDGLHYLVLELVQGVPLDAYVREKRPDRSGRLRLIREACRAINYAHQCGVIHLDIKPSNILIDSQGHPKILDFGLARIIDADAQMTTSVADPGRIQGTLPYMSPEQLDRDRGEIDVRSDVFSLGVVMYELLTGRLPFPVPANARMGVLGFPEDEPPPRPGSIDRSLRGDIETIMLKALEPDPARRYQSALALAEDIERLETNQPIQARPPSGFYNFRKLVSRHKTPFAAAGTFVVLLAAFGVWMSALYGRAHDAERLAQQRLTDTVAAKESAEAEAKRATDATELAQARLQETERSRADLQTIVNFQSDMLVDVEPRDIGQNVLADLRDRIAASLKAEEADPSQTQERLAALDNMFDHVNKAELGNALIDANILRRAAETVSTEFADQPRVQARLDQTIGSVYLRLGDYTQAEQYISAARDTCEREFGPDDPDTPPAMALLARTYRLEGRFDEAEPLYLEALEACRRVFGESHLKTLEIKLDGCNLYRLLGRSDEAYPLCLEALEGRRRVLGEDHPDVLETMNLVAGLDYQKGRLEEAKELLEHILSVRRRELGDEHLDTLTSMNNVAFICDKLGQYEQAEPLYRVALDARRRIQGPEHPEALMAANNLASLYHNSGRLAEAEPLFVEVLATSRRTLGNDHLRTLEAINNLAALYSDESRIDEAIELYKEQFATSQRVLGEEHVLTLLAMTTLGNNYTRQGRLAEAEELLVPALARHRKAFGEAHDLTLKAAFNVAFLRLKQRRFSEAERLYRETLETAKTVWPDGHWHIEWNAAIFGDMLRRLGRFDEARDKLVEAHEFLEQAVGADHVRTREIVGMLIKLFESWDKPDEAAKYAAMDPLYRADLSQDLVP